MKLKSLTIVFENCEHGTVYAQDINSIVLSGITETLSKQASNINISKNVKNVYLNISNNNLELIQRLFKYNDITQLEFEYYDSDKVLYHVDWGNSECYYAQNDRQSTSYCNGREDSIWIRIDDNEDDSDD